MIISNHLAVATLAELAPILFSFDHNNSEDQNRLRGWARPFPPLSYLHPFYLKPGVVSKIVLRNFKRASLAPSGAAFSIELT